MKITILTQGSKNIGLGHFYRSIAAANIFESYQISFFVLVDDLSLDLSENVSSKIDYRQFSDPKQMLNHVSKDSFVIYDGKFLNSALNKNLRKQSGCLMVIDDNHIQELDADIILNHNLHAENLGYERYKTTKLLLGPKYALIRKAFSQNEYRHEILADLKSAVILLGGGDPNNWTFKIYKYFKDIFPHVEFTLVVGKANPHLSMLEKSVSKNDRVVFNLTEIEVAKLLKKSSVLICSASTSFLEGLILGIPMIVGAFAEDQQILAKTIAAKKIAPNLGDCFLGIEPKWDEAVCFFKQQEVRESYHSQYASLKLRNSKDEILKSIDSYLS